MAAAASLTDCVPVRWPSGDPAKLALLEGTPFNCLVVERDNWSGKLAAAASERKARVLGLVRSQEDLSAAPGSGLTAFVIEGDFPEQDVAGLRKRFEVVELGSRRRLLENKDTKVAGTNEALWPGVRLADENNKTQAAPSGAPWIDTNGGFLRFARALTGVALWVGARPPSGLAPSAEQYVAATADAYVSGARWLVSFDMDFEKRLLADDPRALADWRKLSQAVSFYESKQGWLDAQASGQLAIVQDVDSGAAMSAGLLDMLGSRHTPSRIVPTRMLTAEALRGASLVVNVEPASVSSAGQEALRAYTRSGGRLLNAPPGWHFPNTGGYVLALEKLSKDEVAHFDLIWRQITSQTWNKNLGARLYNVASMLSHLVSSPDGSRTCVFLVNYSGYPAENITVHVPGAFARATLHTPEGPPASMDVYAIEDGTGIDIAKFGVTGILEMVRRPVQ